MSRPRRRFTNSASIEFAHICDEALATVRANMTSRDEWITFLNNGAGERNVAGDHQGRFLLELVQNARDAILRGRVESGNSGRGRILVAVTPDGVCVANQGQPFELYRHEVSEAVRFLDRSDKVARAEKGYIGHKGIGLKSVLLHGESYEIYTRLGDGEAKELLRARFSRWETARKILPSLFPELPREDARAVAEACGQEWIDGDEGQPVGDALHLLEGLPRLPLFTTPHEVDGLDVQSGAAGGPKARFLEGLLSGERDQPVRGLDGQGEYAELEAYRTAVFLSFRDRRWHQLLDLVEGLLPQSSLPEFNRGRDDDGQWGQRAVQLTWERLCEDITPQLLILMQHIDELQCLRLDENYELVEGFRYDLAICEEQKGAKFRTRLIKTRRAQWGNVEVDERRFLDFVGATTAGASEVGPDTAEDSRPASEPIHILFEVGVDGEQQLPSRKDHPPYLYYPIEKAGVSFPFVVHGPFQVTPNRKELFDQPMASGEEQGHNWRVFRELLNIFDEVLCGLAQGDSLIDVRPLMPWLVVSGHQPQDGLGRSGRETGSAAWFAEEVQKRLRTLPIVPTDAKALTVEEVIFSPPSPDAFELFRHIDCPGEASSRLLLGDSLQIYRRLARADSGLAQRMVDLGVGEITQRLEDLVHWLCLAMGSYRDRPDLYLDVDPRQAREFHRAVTDAFRRAFEDETSTLDIKAYAQQLAAARVPLIPAEAFDGHGRGHLERTALVRVVSRRQAGRYEKLERVLFRRDPELERDQELAPPPPSIPVYIADTDTASDILDRFGQVWSTVRLDSPVVFFRRIIDRVARSDAYDSDVLAYLIELYGRLRRESRADLEPRPYGDCDWDAYYKIFKGARASRAATKNQDARDRFRQRRAMGAILLPTESGEEVSARELGLGPQWVAVLSHQFSDRNAPGGHPIECGDQEVSSTRQRWAQALEATVEYRRQWGITRRYIAPPNSPAWASLYEALGDNKGGDREQWQAMLLDWLLFVGVQLGPVVESWWFNPGDKPTDPTVPGALSLDDIYKLANGEADTSQKLPIPESLLSDYARLVRLSHNHPAFSTHGGSKRCRQMRRQDKDRWIHRRKDVFIGAWAWLPELARLREQELSPGGIRAFIEALNHLAPELLGTQREGRGALQTDWICSVHHQVKSQKRAIPTVGLYQLRRAPIWPVRNHGFWAELGHQAATLLVQWPELANVPASTDPNYDLPAIDNRVVSPDVAAAVGVTSLDNLPPHRGLELLSWFLNQSRRSDGSQKMEGAFEVADLRGMSFISWRRVIVALSRRILASTGADGVIRGDEETLMKWRRHDLALIQGHLLASRSSASERGRRYYALSLTGDESRQAAFERQDLLACREHIPREAHHLEPLQGNLVMEAIRRQEARAARFYEACGAQIVPIPERPLLQGQIVGDSRAARRLREGLRERLVLLVGALKYKLPDNYRSKVELLIEGIDELVELRVDSSTEGPQFSSGLVEDGERTRHAFTASAYAKTRGHGSDEPLFILVDGLAQKVGHRGIRTLFELVLSLPVEQAKRRLEHEGVYFMELVESLDVLARRWIDNLAEAAMELIIALVKARQLEYPELPLTAEGDAAQIQRELRESSGEVFHEWSTRFIAIGFTEEETQRLMESLVADGLSSPVRTLREVLAMLDGAPLEISELVLENLSISACWKDCVGWFQEPAAMDAVARYGLFRGLMTLLDTLEDGGDPVASGLHFERPIEASSAAMRKAKASLEPATSTADLFEVLDYFGPYWEPDQWPRTVLLRWEEQDWRRFVESLEQIVEGQLEKTIIDESVLQAIRHAWESGSLTELRQVMAGQEAQTDTQAVRARVDRKFYDGRMDFDFSIQLEEGPSKQEGPKFTPTPRPVGQGKGVGRGVDERHQQRGRIAELYALQRCWELFIRHDASTREAIIDAVVEKRSNHDYPNLWSTKAGKHRAMMVFERWHSTLIGKDKDLQKTFAKRAFLKLLDVSGERGPGFDLIDPFAAARDPEEEWSAAAIAAVEVKAIHPDTSRGRLILTTNEFRQARYLGRRYILRTLVVPSDPTQVQQVYFHEDIVDPVRTLELESHLAGSVRGGTIIMDWG